MRRFFILLSSHLERMASLFKRMKRFFSLINLYKHLYFNGLNGGFRYLWYGCDSLRVYFKAVLAESTAFYYCIFSPCMVYDVTAQSFLSSNIFIASFLVMTFCVLILFLVQSKLSIMQMYNFTWYKSSNR